MDNQSTTRPLTEKKYILRMHQSLMERILKHISCLKFTNPSYQSTRGWILKAVEEKLTHDESLEIPKLPKISHVLLELDTATLERLERQVNLIKKLKGSYSIKSWVIDAIEDKLMRDSHKVSQIAAQIRFNRD